MPQRISVWTAPLNQNGGRRKRRQHAALSLLALILPRLSNTSFSDSQEMDMKRGEIDKWICKMQTRKKRSEEPRQRWRQEKNIWLRDSKCEKPREKRREEGRIFRAVMRKLLRDASLSLDYHD